MPHPDRSNDRWSQIVTQSPQPGDAAPGFSLATARGAVSLADYRGRSLVLFFYPKDDTSGCTKEALEFSEKLPQFAARGADVLGVSRDDVASHERFAAKHGLSVALASDDDGKACAAYGVWTQKSMYGRTYMGIERSTFLIGPDGVVAAAWRKVKVPGHAEAVLAALAPA
jgi:peroxiredoxin Q/BCP